MAILQKLATAKHMATAKGPAATLRFAGGWIGRRCREAILGPPPQTWRKFYLINELARIHGYRSVLEISTASSGFTFHQLDPARFDICRRLSYLTPDDWTDGAPVHYRSCSRETSECMRQIRARGLRFDIVFVDGCHEYESTRRDMRDALSLVNDDGIIVMHDCLPVSEAVCAPTRGELFDWCGLTYKAYLDVLLEHHDLWYCTVDTDVGCGMIRSNQKTHLYKRAVDGFEEIISAWRATGDNHRVAYQLYERDKDALMNVVTINEFLIAERKNRVRRAREALQ